MSWSTRTTMARTTMAAILALSLAGGIATAAFATDDPGPVTPAPSEALPASAQGRCLGAIDRRVNHLAVWSARINSRTNLQPAEKAALVAQMTAVSTDLTTIAKPAVLAATTRAELRAACQAIVTGYRVYLVVYPRVFITAAAEGWLNRITELEGKAATLALAGKDVSGVTTLLDAAKLLAQPIPGNLAAITPTSYNANPAGTKAAFNAAKGSLETVRMDVRAAAKLLRHLAKS